MQTSARSAKSRQPSAAHFTRRSCGAVRFRADCRGRGDLRAGGSRAWRHRPTPTAPGRCQSGLIGRSTSGRCRRLTDSASRLELSRPATVSESGCQRNADTVSRVQTNRPCAPQGEERVEVHGVLELRVEAADRLQGVEPDHGSGVRDEVGTPGQQELREPARVARGDGRARAGRCSRSRRRRARPSGSPRAVPAAARGRRDGTGRRRRSRRSSCSSVRCGESAVDGVGDAGLGVVDDHGSVPRRPVARGRCAAAGARRRA